MNPEIALMLFRILVCLICLAIYYQITHSEGY
jgi:hypothetical protein